MTEEEYDTARRLQRRRRARAKKRRRKRTIKATLLLCCVLAVVFAAGKIVLSGGLPTLPVNDEENPDYTADNLSENVTYEDWLQNTDLDDTAKTALIEMSKQESRVGEILQNADAYPQELLIMLSKNAETLDFVYNYMAKKDEHIPINLTKKDMSGEIPLFLQWDERWGYENYGEGLIAVAGCGPTSLAMVVAGLTEDASVNPKTVADYSNENGYRVTGQGTAWTLMSEGCKAFGLAAKELPLSENKMKTELDAGHPIIVVVGAGDFTDSGHYIVIYNYNNEGEFIIRDPNSRVRTKQTWSYDTLSGQILNLWSYTRS